VVGLVVGGCCRARPLAAGGPGGICGGAIGYVPRHAIGQRIGKGGVEHLLALLAGDVHLLPRGIRHRRDGGGFAPAALVRESGADVVSSSGSTGVGPSTKEPVCSSLMRCAMDLSPEVPSSA